MKCLRTSTGLFKNGNKFRFCIYTYTTTAAVAKDRYYHRPIHCTSNILLFRRQWHQSLHMYSSLHIEHLYIYFCLYYTAVSEIRTPLASLRNGWTNEIHIQWFVVTVCHTGLGEISSKSVNTKSTKSILQATLGLMPPTTPISILFNSLSSHSVLRLNFPYTILHSLHKH